MRPAPVFVAVGALLLAIAGCGGKASVDRAAAPCETRVPSAHPADTVTVVIFDTIDPKHAPWPRNRSERFVFSHLYETLVNIDCHGQVQPGIAKSWKEASDGWYIEIAEDAHFWDDTMVTAADVQTSFQPVMQRLSIGPVDIVDETHAIIHGHFDLRLLSLPTLPIFKQARSVFPIGTGEWEIDTDNSGSTGIVMRPTSAKTPTVIFEQANPSEAMDILSSPADAMISDDASLIDYARTKPAATLIPLAWDQAYVLIDPVRARYAAWGDKITELPQALLDALARDAIPGDARGGSSILTRSWNAPIPRVGDDMYRGGSPSNRVLFVAGDPTARSLAERIVALADMDTNSSADARAVKKAMPGTTPGMRAVGMPVEDFDKALLSYTQNSCYVVPLSWDMDFPLPRSPFLNRAPWLVGVGSPWRGLIPLIETRAYFIALNDHLAITRNETGGVHFTPPGAERVR